MRHLVFGLTQLLLVYPLVGIFALPILHVCGRRFPGGTTPVEPYWHGPDILVFFSVGLTVGIALVSLAPALQRTARWVWCVPAAFFSYCVIIQLLSGAFSTRYSDLLYTTGDNEGGLTVMLVTLPTFSLAGHSLGAFLSGKWLTHRVWLRPD